MLKRIFISALIFIIAGGFFIWPQRKAEALGSPIRINEVAPAEASGQDWIEFYVAESGDFGGYVVKERTTVIKTFPDSFNLMAGDFIVLHIDQNGTDEDATTGKGANGYWDLYSSDTGLIGTDNVIILEDNLGNVVDALCFANSDGTWTSSQQNAFNSAISGGQWTGTIDGGAAINEAECADWASGEAGFSLGRDEISSDSDNQNVARDDWSLKAYQTPGAANKENQPPSIILAEANPSSIPADDQTLSLLTVQVSDPEGLLDITSVVIDLSEIGGDDVQEMYDNGENGGDVEATDGIYSFEVTVPISIPADTYDLTITVCDSVGNEASDALTLEITKPTYSNKIQFNEILPNPTGTESTDEFIELKNTGDTDVDLKNWRIEDTSSSYTISSSDFTSTKIPALGYFVIYRNESGIALNNSGGETVKLYQPNGNLLDSVSYTESAPEGQSYNLSEDSWKWSTTLTPGAANKITLPNQKPNANAGENKEANVGESVIFDGSDSFDPDGDTLSFTWDFGDGTKASGNKVTHSYSKAGKYTVVLTVDDGRGGIDTDTVKVTILENEINSNQEVSGPFSDKIVINEILPNPEGSDVGEAKALVDKELSEEFIELYNKGNSSVDLSSWQLDDEEGGSSPYTIENKIIAAGEYLVFWRSETGLALNNNGGDSVRLLHPDGKIISEVTYQESAKEGQAYALDSDNLWKWTMTPTPGEANLISEPEENNDENLNTEVSQGSGGKDDYETNQDIQEISIAEARTKTKNTKVKVRGIALVEPGLLGKKIFYIQDSTSGIQIYFSKEDFPNLKLGDEVSVVGKVSESQNEKKINVQKKSDIQILGHKSSPKPYEIKTGDVKEKYEGQLVQVAGEITKSSGNVFYADDGSGQAKIYVKKTTGIEKPKLKKGDKITIWGIVSETSSGYRILPRYQNDIKGGISGNLFNALPQAGNNLWFVVLFAFLAVLYFELPKLIYKLGHE